ncbi:MAG: DUF4176 domain-containing protein [Lachnospiraceae bacterium]|jgi:hypothetical protein|nr:DUF4176 domain-containing protein [Lachnospiraceae bacterium]
MEEKKNYKGLLPIGSVVRIEEIEQYLVISGRIVCAEGDDKIYDYVGFPYPEGMGRGDDLLFFDKEDIAQVFFIGFQDETELIYRTQILDELGELTVEDGEIVSAEEDEG